MYFDVKAMKPGAGVVRLTIDATDAGEAGHQAETQGLAVLSVIPRAGQSLRRGGRFPLLLFNQELLALLEAGVSLIEALETLVEKEQRSLVRNVLVQLVRRLREGQNFSAALQDHPASFPPLFVATLRASEKTSDLQEALRRYIAHQTHMEAARGKLIGAAIYPMLLLAVGGLVLLFLMGYVVPRFSHIYEDMGSRLPFMSRLLLAWGNLLQDWWPVLLGTLLALGSLGVHLFRKPAVQASLAGLLWRVPELGERLRVIHLARFYRTLGMLLSGGVAVVPAIEMSSGLLSPMLQPALARAKSRIHDGMAISDAMEGSGLVTAVALRMLRVGERAGNMGVMMESIAAFHEEENGRWLEWATRLFGPVLMLLMGLLIGLVVVLLYLPIFQLADSLG
ncbi:MAG: type II secretion system F family protein [Rhodocyclaceae bacterium]|nr:type II secretion system F family protein [Rhodocyclaceae bacterium]